MTAETFLGRKRQEFDPPVRGDVITADRFILADRMKAEWDAVWTRRRSPG